MSQIKFEQSGVDAIAAGVVATGNTHKARLIDLTATSNLNKAITGATNATPIQVTSTSHGFSVGDIVIIQGVLGNTSANGTYRIKAAAANTFDLQTLAAQGETALDVVGMALIPAAAGPSMFPKLPPALPQPISRRRPAAPPTRPIPLVALKRSGPGRFLNGFPWPPPL
jgi:hypothetical protein